VVDAEVGPALAWYQTFPVTRRQGDKSNARLGWGQFSNKTAQCDETWKQARDDHT
jgi:hypothetical protein